MIMSGFCLNGRLWPTWLCSAGLCVAMQFTACTSLKLKQSLSRHSRMQRSCMASGILASFLSERVRLKSIYSSSSPQLGFAHGMGCLDLQASATLNSSMGDLQALSCLLC